MAANTSFFKNTGTSTQLQGSASASAAAALASEQAAAASQTAASTSETNAAASAAASATSAAQSLASANSSAASQSNAATSEANALAASTSASSDAASASADATQTAADRVQTGLDRVATAADAVQTAADRVQTGLDVTSSSASAAAALSSRNAAATSETNAAASAASSSADATATASDRVQTGLDAASTAADAIATAADRVQTGLDATSASNSASAASTSATAASASQVSAASSAASAAAVFNDFEDRYYGPHASDSAAQTYITGQGLTVDQGDLYFNSTANEMRVFDGGSWIAASSAGGASLINYNYTATAAQTTFSGSDDNSNTLSYTVDNLIVTRNGVVLEDRTDYTATSGTSIVLASAASAGDEINVVAFKSFTTADMVSATNGGTFQGNVDFAAGIDVTGNVTVTGTVDGRDVATDGTKLDGIEAGADVTDATNVAAAGALMTTGGSVTGDVSFGDNDKAIFGAGSDLQIYHDGADSFVKESGTGNLNLASNGTGVHIVNDTDNETMATFHKNGASTLYYDNAAKLATTATGVDVTGLVKTHNAYQVWLGANVLGSDGGLTSIGANPIVIGTDGQERFRILSTGDIAFGNSVANTVSGFSNQPGGGYVASDSHFEFATTSNRAAVEIGKNNANDGQLVAFRKQGGTVGSIGTGNSNRPYIGGGDTGIMFDANNHAIYPWDTSTNGVPASDQVKLGYNATGLRFSNIHLNGRVSYDGSGGVRIDGTNHAYIRKKGTHQYQFDCGSFTAGQGKKIFTTNAWTAGGGSITVFQNAGFFGVGQFSFILHYGGCAFTLQHGTTNYATFSVNLNTPTGGQTEVFLTMSYAMNDVRIFLNFDGYPYYGAGELINSVGSGITMTEVSHHSLA